MSRMPRRVPVAIAVLLATVLTLAGTATATASWTASSSTSAAVRPATARVSLSYATAAPSLAAIYAVANAPSISTLSLANTGTAPLSYALTVSSSSASIPLASVGVAVWAEAVCATPANWGTLAAPPALPSVLRSGAPATSLTVCVATRFTDSITASVGLGATVALGVTGAVGTSWTASASLAPFTVSVRLGALAKPTCTASLYNLLSTQTTLAWTPLSGTGVVYALVDTSSGAVIVPNSSTATSMVVRYENLAVGANSVALRATDAFGSVSTGPGFTLTASSLLNLGVLIYSATCS